jgi:hypothetical protein
VKEPRETPEVPTSDHRPDGRKLLLPEEVAQITGLSAETLRVLEPVYEGVSVL